MSVPNTDLEQENQLAEMEAQAMKELEAESSAAPENEAAAIPQDSVEGETVTPDAASTTAEQTTTPTPTGDGEQTLNGEPQKGPGDQADQSNVETGEENGEPSEKAQNRYQELANRMKAAEEAAKAAQAEAKQLREMVKPRGPVTIPGQTQLKSRTALPWEDGGDGEVTIEDYKADVANTAQQIVQQQTAVNTALSYVTYDRLDLEREHPELNEDSPEFDPELTEFIAAGYLERLKQNPALRLKEYASKILSIRQKAAEKARSVSASTLQRQAASQPITGQVMNSRQPTIEDSFSGAKSIEELDAIASKMLPVSK